MKSATHFVLGKKIQFYLKKCNEHPIESEKSRKKMKWKKGQCSIRNRSNRRSKRSRFDFRRGSGRRRRRGKPVPSFHFVFFYQKKQKNKISFCSLFFRTNARQKKMQSEPSSDFSHMNFVFSFIFFPFLFIWFFFGFFSAIFGAADRRGNGRRTMAAWDFYFFFLVVFFKVIKLS